MVAFSRFPPMEAILLAQKGNHICDWRIESVIRVKQNGRIFTNFVPLSHVRYHKEHKQTCNLRIE